MLRRTNLNNLKRKNNKQHFGQILHHLKKLMINNKYLKKLSLSKKMRSNKVMINCKIIN